MKRVHLVKNMEMHVSSKCIIKNKCLIYVLDLILLDLQIALRHLATYMKCSEYISCSRKT